MASCGDRASLTMAFVGNPKMQPDVIDSVIDMHIDGLGWGQEIFAKVKGRFDATKENFLIIQRRVTEGRSRRSEQLDCITLAPAMMATLSFTRRVFHTYEDMSVRTLNADGSVSGQRRARREDKPIPIRSNPESYEIGATYKATVHNDEGGIYVTIAKVTRVASGATKQQAELGAEQALSREQLGVAGMHLVEEGLNNLDLAAHGGAPLFDADSTQADVGAHGLRGVVRSFQHMAPGIEEPQGKPTETVADLRKLSIDELQKLFDEAYTADKKHEADRMAASMEGDVARVNAIMQKEHITSQRVMLIALIIEEKGGTAQIPESSDAAAMQSAQLQMQALDQMVSECNPQ